MKVTDVLYRDDIESEIRFNLNKEKLAEYLKGTGDWFCNLDTNTFVREGELFDYSGALEALFEYFDENLLMDLYNQLMDDAKCKYTPETTEFVVKRR